MLPIAARLALAGVTLVAVSTVARGPAKRPVPPAVGAPELKDGALVTRDGARLPCAAWLPAHGGEPAAVLLALHNFGDYRAAFNLAGPWFAERGVAVYAYDQRGFGETASRGTWAGAETMARDLSDAVQALRRRHPGRPPLYAVGESMGGAVILAGLGLGKVAGVDGLILAAPGVREGVPLRTAHDVGFWIGASLAPGASFRMNRGGRPWQHPDEARRLATDPLVVREVRVDTCWGLTELANLASDHAGAVKAPTLLLYGERDSTIHKVAIVNLAKRLGGPVTTIRYPTRYHLPLHEKDPEEVFEHILEWIDRRHDGAIRAVREGRPVPLPVPLPRP